MADDACLVDFEEVPGVSYDPRQNIPPLPITADENFSLLHDTGGISTGSERSVPDLIVAVFIVQFDTRRGIKLSL